MSKLTLTTLDDLIKCCTHLTDSRHKIYEAYYSINFAGEHNSSRWANTKKNTYGRKHRRGKKCL